MENANVVANKNSDDEDVMTYCPECDCPQAFPYSCSCAKSNIAQDREEREDVMTYCPSCDSPHWGPHCGCPERFWTLEQYRAKLKV